MVKITDNQPLNPALKKNINLAKDNEKSPKQVSLNNSSTSDSFISHRVSDLKQLVSDIPDVDQDLVSKLKQQIAADQYAVDPEDLARVIIRRSLQEDF